jgi:hypothetical protein
MTTQPVPDTALSKNFVNDNEGCLDVTPLEFDEEGDDGEPIQCVNSSRKRLKRAFPWDHARNWVLGDSPKENGKRQCTVCRRWFSGTMNGSGWTAHLKNAHGIIGSPVNSSAPAARFGVPASSTLMV